MLTQQCDTETEKYLNSRAEDKKWNSTKQPLYNKLNIWFMSSYQIIKIPKSNFVNSSSFSRNLVWNQPKITIGRFCVFFLSPIQRVSCITITFKDDHNKLAPLTNTNQEEFLKSVRWFVSYSTWTVHIVIFCYFLLHFSRLLRSNKALCTDFVFFFCHLWLFFFPFCNIWLFLFSIALVEHNF